MDEKLMKLIHGEDTQDKRVNFGPTAITVSDRDSMDAVKLTPKTTRDSEERHVLNLGKTTIRKAVNIRDELVKLMDAHIGEDNNYLYSLDRFMGSVFSKLTSIPKGYTVESVSAGESNVALKHDEDQDAEGVRYTIQKALDKGQLLEIIYEKKAGERSTKRIRVKELKPWGVRARTVQGDRSYNWEKIISAEVVKDSGKKLNDESVQLFAISINRTLMVNKSPSGDDLVTSYHRVSLHLVNENLVLIDLHRDRMSNVRDPWQL